MIPTIPFNQVSISEQFRNRKPVRKDWLINGLDTETDGRINDGYARIIANQDKWTTLSNIDDVLSFLKSKKHQNALNFFYNLRYDFEVMFKHDTDVFLEFVKEGVECEIDYERKGIDYKIFYIPGKLLSIKWFHKSVKFYDIAQFFKKSLEVASLQYLKIHPHKLKGERHDLFSNYTLSEIGDYCISDSYQTKLLAEWYLKQLSRLDFYPSALISPGNLSAQYLLKNTDVPKVKHVPTDVLEYYFHSFRGGWFDIYKRGTIKTRRYDINSSYPSEFYNKPDIRDGRWVNEFRSDTNLGVVKCLVNSSPNHFLPLGLPTKTGGRVYNTIDDPFEAYLTKREFITLEKDYSLELINAYSFVETPLPRTPFKQVIENLYKMKSENKHDPGIYTSTKEIVNSIYGKTVEKRKKKVLKPVTNAYETIYLTGNLWNPVYSSECTAGCRMQIYETFKKYAKDVVSVATDGIALTTKPHGIKISKDLGEWDYEGNGFVTYIMSGIYCDGNGVSKSRGLKKIPDLRASLDTTDSEITIDVLRPTHFKEAIIQDRIEAIGTFENHQRTLTARGDLKRLWLEEPESMRDLLHNVYKSLPIPNSLGGA